MSETRFPLDAEQIVRLAAGMTAEIANALRHPDAKPVDAGQVLLRLADLAGVPVARERARTGLARYAPLPYGAGVSPDAPTDGSPAPASGAGHEA